MYVDNHSSSLVCSFKKTTSRSAQSNLTNKSRLRLLHRREEQLQELFAIARSQIVTFAEDEGRYTQFLQGAIVQGFLQLMEPRVTLIVREKDVERVQKVGEAAAETYSELSGRRITFDVQGTLSDERYVCIFFLSCRSKLLIHHRPVLEVSNSSTAVSE